MFGKLNSIDNCQRNLDKKIVICVPTNGMVHAMFSFHLIAAIRYTESQGFEVALEMSDGTVLSNQRQMLLNNAFDEHDADYIMWLDSDMIFPKDVIVRLINHSKQVVCATYSKRVKPFHPTAFLSLSPNVIPVDTTEHGLVTVNYTGLGCLLSEASVIDKIPSPHFPLKWDAPTSTWHGEDMGFCDLLTNDGIEIFCDLDLSREIGHLGIREFRVNQEY